MKRGGREVEYETFLAELSKPARNALLHAKILSFEQIAALTEKEFLSFHGAKLLLVFCGNGFSLSYKTEGE